MSVLVRKQKIHKYLEDGSFSQDGLANSVQKQLDKGWTVERTFTIGNTVWVIYNTQTFIEVTQEHVYQ